MPVYSMTGYASGQHSPAQAAARRTKPGPPRTGRLGLEIRSVNSRFLDLTFRLPEELRQHEPALRELLTGTLKRGKVEVRAGVENGAGAEAVREPVGPAAAAPERRAGHRAQPGCPTPAP